jgi:hypothetical protein
MFTMIRRAVIVTFLFLLGAASSAVAQNCDWDKVKSWTGHYQITETGTVTQPEGCTRSTIHSALTSLRRPKEFSVRDKTSC